MVLLRINVRFQCESVDSGLGLAPPGSDAAGVSTVAFWNDQTVIALGGAKCHS